MSQPPRFVLQLRRSNVYNRRPSPSTLSEGELAVNCNARSPGVFFKDTDQNLVKVGVAQVGEDAPGSTGSAIISVGELWYDTVAEVLMIWVGTEWKPAVPAAFVDPQPRVQSIVFVNSDGSNSTFVEGV
jgi:hypothetical protein